MNEGKQRKPRLSWLIEYFVRVTIAGYINFFSFLFKHIRQLEERLHLQKVTELFILEMDSSFLYNPMK